jgi:hypothetical protein
VSILIAFSKVNLKFGCRKGTCFGLSLCLVFLGKLSFSLVNFLGSCGIRLAVLMGVCRCFGFCEGYGYVQK